MRRSAAQIGLYKYKLSGGKNMVGKFEFYITVSIIVSLMLSSRFLGEDNLLVTGTLVAIQLLYLVCAIKSRVKIKAT